MPKLKSPFPSTLFVVHEIDGGLSYFLASESGADVDIDAGKARLVATYELVNTKKVSKKVELVEVK
jgi:hypothetical protein